MKKQSSPTIFAITRIWFILIIFLVPAICSAQAPQVTRTVLANLDTVVRTTTFVTNAVVTLDTLPYKKPVPAVVMPGGQAMSSTTPYNNQNNITITGKTITGGTLTFNNCKNVTINLCKFDGGKGTNLYAMTFNNCTNVSVTNCYGTMYCKFVMVLNGSGIKVNNNQFLNLYEPVLYGKDFAHAIQYNNVTGAGNQVNNNIIENIYGVAVHPHDLINLYNCAGTSASHVQVSGNKLRGGQVDGGWPDSGDTGAGITLDNGSYIDVTNNIGVNPGCAFIQVNGTHSNILVDNNTGVSLIASKVAADAIIALGSKSNVTISNNKVNWIKYNGATGANYPGGEVLFWFGGSANPAGIKLVNNVFDKTLTASILPATIITYK